MTTTAAPMGNTTGGKRNVSFDLGEKASDQFMDAFLNPGAFGGAYKDFLGPLRNTTDDLTIKFFEAAETTQHQHQGAPHNHGHPAPFAPFDPSYSSQSASGMFPSPLGFPEKRVPAQQEQSTGGYQQHQNQQQQQAPQRMATRSISRSFSLIMDVYEQQTAMDHLPPKHMEILLSNEAPPPGLRELYNKAGTGHSTNFLKEKASKIPQKRVDELITSLRSQNHNNKRARTYQQDGAGSPANKMMVRQEMSCGATTKLGDYHAYERNLSIGSRIVRALERSRTENVDPAQRRREARKQLRTEKAAKNSKQMAISTTSAAAISSHPAGSQHHSNQIYVEVEMLMQQTRAVVQENQNLKIKLDMMQRLNEAQAKKLEEQGKGKKGKK